MASTNWENLPSTNTPLNAANLNKIENRLKTHFIPTNVDNIQGWYLALSGSVTTYNNNAFKLSVVNIFSNKSGTLYVNIRRDDGALRIDAFIWETNTGLNSSHFKLKTDGNNYYLYMRTNTEYAKYQIKVLEGSDLMNNNEDILTFYTPTASDTVTEPTGEEPKYKNSCIDLGNGNITSNDLNNAITINNINFDELEAISVQFGNPAEGDSKIFLIANNGEILNDVVHMDMYATSDYHCRGFAYVGYSSGHIGSLSIVAKQLLGWTSVSYKVRGLKRN